MPRLSHTPKRTALALSAMLIGFLTFSQSPCLAYGQGAQAKLIAKRQPLKSLVPEEDLSQEPDPGDLFDQAVKAYSQGKMPEAEKLFEQVVRLQPRNADAHFNLGAIKEWANDLPSALKHYRAALSAKPRDREITEALQAVQYKIDNKEALELQNQRDKREKALSMHGQMAKEAFSTQNYAQAIKHLTQLANAMPEDAKIQFALGQSLRALKYYDWSAYRLKMAIYFDPENELYRKTLVELDREIQDAQEQALNQGANMALTHITPLEFTELTESGFSRNVF